MPVAADEDIVRAICTDKWDGRRISPSAFAGSDTSVSRLAVIPLSDHWDMFRKKLEKPPERKLELIGEIKVDHLQKLGREYKYKIELTVEPKPENWNPAHAEIPQKITRGLANQIVNALKRHKPPQ